LNRSYKRLMIVIVSYQNHSYMNGSSSNNKDRRNLLPWACRRISMHCKVMGRLTASIIPLKNHRNSASAWCISRFQCYSLESLRSFIVIYWHCVYSVPFIQVLRISFFPLYKTNPGFSLVGKLAPEGNLELSHQWPRVYLTQGSS
jgi:hypothetical protein